MGYGYRGVFLLLIFAALANVSYGEKLIIDDMTRTEGTPRGENCENKDSRWCLVTDQVMGGISKGELVLSPSVRDGFIKLKGLVSTDNNGGFIQARTFIENHPDNVEFRGIRIKVRGNNQEYAIHIRTKYLVLPWQYYSVKFQALSTWETLELKLSHFKKSNFYQPNNFQSKDIRSVALVAIGKDFSADVDLGLLEFF